MRLNDATPAEWDRLRRAYDVLLLCEVLDITPENILEAFEDKLIINRNKFTEDTPYETE